MSKQVMHQLPRARRRENNYGVEMLNVAVIAERSGELLCKLLLAARRKLACGWGSCSVGPGLGYSGKAPFVCE